MGLEMNGQKVHLLFSSTHSLIVQHPTHRLHRPLSIRSRHPEHMSRGLHLGWDLGESWNFNISVASATFSLSSWIRIAWRILRIFLSPSLLAFWINLNSSILALESDLRLGLTARGRVLFIGWLVYFNCFALKTRIDCDGSRPPFHSGVSEADSLSADSCSSGQSSMHGYIWYWLLSQLIKL